MTAVQAARARLRGLTLFNAAAGAVVLIVTALVVYPLGKMVLEVVVVNGSPTVGAFRRAWSDPVLLEAARNTALIVGLATVGAVVIASLFAWCNERTDARMGWISDLMPLVPLLVPAVATTIGFVFLFSPGAGIANVELRKLFRLVGIHFTAGPIDLFTRPTLIAVYILFLVPFAYLPIAAALRNVDPAYEEVARVCGAGVFRTLRIVTLPIVAPAIASAGLVSLVIGLALFTAPVVIGSRARINVVSVHVYKLVSVYPPRKDEAVAVGLSLLAVIAVAATVERRIRRRGNFATISGRARREARVHLGGMRWVVRAAMLLYVALTSVLPFIALLILSMQKFWTAKLHLRWDTQNYRDVFFNDDFAQKGLKDSLILGVAGATISVFVIALLARYTRRAGRIGGSVVEFVTKIPATLSHLVMALAFLIALGPLKFPGTSYRLQGTLTILLLVYFVIYLPFGSVLANAAYAQVGRDLTETAQVCGASPGRTFTRIELPLIMPGLVAVWSLSFVLMAGDLTASVFLVGPNTPVIGSVILDRFENGGFQLIAALGTVMSVVTLTVVGGAQLIGRRFLSIEPPQT